MALLSCTTLRLAPTSRSSGRHSRTTCAAHERVSHQVIKIERPEVGQCEDENPRHPSGAVASRRQALQRACLTVAAATITGAPWLWQPIPASAAEGLLAEESETVELPKGERWQEPDSGPERQRSLNRHSVLDAPHRPSMLGEWEWD